MAVGFKRLSQICFRTERLISRNSRNIVMTSPRLEKALENLQDNPYYEKYADRIAQLQKTSPEEFLARLQTQDQSQKNKKQNEFGSVDTRQFSSALNPKQDLKDKVAPEDKKLESIFKIELVKDKDATEIRDIWELYHKNKEVISATILIDQYLDVHRNMQEFPTFLVPLPRSQGYEFIMCQSLGHTVHFTPLLAYQVHKENAPECLTMVHYTELKDKGIVLMRGEYDKNVLSGKEAQCLANQFQLFYNGKDSRKTMLLQNFTKSPDTFKHMDLITELENISLP